MCGKDKQIVTEQYLEHAEQDLWVWKIKCSKQAHVDEDFHPLICTK